MRTLRAHRNRKLRFIPGLRRSTGRRGISLIDMAFALGVASFLLMGVLTLVADGQRMRIETDKLNVAVSLAQAKMAQLISNTDLKEINESGSFGEESGVLDGYEWEVETREEKIDLAMVAETGEFEGISVDDQMPTGVQNEVEDDSSKFTDSATNRAAGIIDIMRIYVTIRYPRGEGNAKGEYRVETFRENKKIKKR